MEGATGSVRFNLRDFADKVARRMQRNAIDIYLGDDLRPPEPTKPVYRFGHWV